MLAAIFRAAAGPDRCRDAGQLNNAIGVPLDAARAARAHRSPCRARHEPSRRDARARGDRAPTIALVTNAQREHQEFMRSVAEVADEHADAIAALPRGGRP
jgi:UDP-N-acetylmuramoyl-tripeptide--D-alanyl-D-alanine ligase